MYAIKPYNRMHAIEYARRWALERNPLFTNFAGFGGDCTNFVSQCIYAGSCVMNETPTFGWYYRGPGDYAPAWTGVSYLFNFLITNMEAGPIGVEVPPAETEPGDVIQLGYADGTFYHTLIVSAKTDTEIYVCAHTNDVLDRPLSSYTAAETARGIHIHGIRFEAGTDACFDGLYMGTSL